MKLLFVVNTSAYRAQHVGLPGRIRRRFPRGDVLVDPLLGELSERCRRIDGAGREAIVAVGGDGTINRVLNVIGERDIPIGIVPMGRANDLARELRIPADAEGALEILEAVARRSSTTRLARIDLLSVNGRRFATCGGTDIAAAVAARSHRWSRAHRWASRVGMGLYVAAAVREVLGPLPDHTFRIEYPGHCGTPHEALALLVSNQARFGGHFEASPLASNRDGLLDICVVPRPRCARQTAELIRSAIEGRLAGIARTQHYTTSEARLTASRSVRFFGDGEILAQGSEFILRVHVGAATVLVPAEGSPSSWT